MAASYRNVNHDPPSYDWIPEPESPAAGHVCDKLCEQVPHDDCPRWVNGRHVAPRLKPDADRGRPNFEDVEPDPPPVEEPEYDFPEGVENGVCRNLSGLTIDPYKKGSDIASLLGIKLPESKCPEVGKTQQLCVNDKDPKKWRLIAPLCWKRTCPHCFFLLRYLDVVHYGPLLLYAEHPLRRLVYRVKPETVWYTGHQKLRRASKSACLDFEYVKAHLLATFAVYTTAPVNDGVALTGEEALYAFRDDLLSQGVRRDPRRGAPDVSASQGWAANHRSAPSNWTAKHKLRLRDRDGFIDRLKGGGFTSVTKPLDGGGWRIDIGTPSEWQADAIDGNMAALAAEFAGSCGSPW